MRLFSMTKFMLMMAVCAASAVATFAQEDGANGPPSVLVIQREYTKPGKGGSEHARTEGAFAKAMAAGKAPAHYFAMTSMSGPDRVLFFSGYATFADWETANTGMAKDATLGATLDRLNVEDGDMLSASDASVWMQRPDESLNPGNLVGKRYMQIEMFKVKPGHGWEWDEVVKMVTEAYKKGVPDAGWVMFQQVYGTGGASYVVLIPMKTLGDVDHSFAEGKAFVEALGKDGLKKLEELEASCIEEEQTNLFHFNPAMSYVPDAWVKADPDFWKPKVVVVKKKVEVKPAP